MKQRQGERKEEEERDRGVRREGRRSVMRREEKEGCREDYTGRKKEGRMEER